MSSTTVIQSVLEKVDELIADNRKLRSELRKVTDQRDQILSENRDLKTRLGQLEKRIAVLELKNGFSGMGDNKLARARVNRLMREVDKCIALLNRDQA